MNIGNNKKTPLFFFNDLNWRWTAKENRRLDVVDWFQNQF